MSLRIYILIFLSMLAVSLSPIIARYLDHLHPITISFWRMLIATILILIYSYFKHDAYFKNSNPLKIMIAGCLLGIHFSLFYGAISLMPNNIANATVFGTMAPLFTLLIEIYFGRKISSTLIFGLLIVLLGSFLMFFYDFSFSHNLILGNILAISCSLCFAFVFIISEQLRKTTSSIILSQNLFLYASILLFIIAVFFRLPLFNISIYDFIFLFFLALISTLIGHSVLYYLVKYLRPTIVASIPLGEPFIASLLAWFLFPGQILNIYIIIGGATTLIGLFLIIQTKK